MTVASYEDYFHEFKRIDDKLVNLLLDVLSFTTWGLYNNVTFKNHDGVGLHSIETILKAIEVDGCLYIETDNMDFLEIFQKSIKGILKYNKENSS
jgi:hypothetical protein